MTMIVVLTGAGISRESGLETFRDQDGVWSKVRLEDVATPEGYHRDPARVLEFYNHRRRELSSGTILPNAAHFALARLEKEWPGEFLLVTQNIDDLHERAGSRQLLHMHGELLRAVCTACDGVFPCLEDQSLESVCSACGEKGRLRPQVVWFGETPLELDRIFAALGKCAWFVSIGTSGNVYPAAGFVDHVRSSGDARTVELNLEPSRGASLFAETIYGPATRVVPAFVERLLTG